AALDTLAALAQAAPEGTRRALLQVARLALEGEIAARAGRLGEAETRLRAAVAGEDALPYMEPPYWHHPLRHALGAVLLQAGKAREAETVYREALARFPANGWALFGLWKSLVQQRKAVDAAEVERQFQTAWRG